MDPQHFLVSDHLSPLETPLDSIINGTEATVQNRGLELKLDLYVPIPPIIEPITPVEETVELCLFPVATQEDDTQPDAAKGETDGTTNTEGFNDESQPSLVESSLDTPIEEESEQASNETGPSESKDATCVPEEPVSSKEMPEICDNTNSSSGSKVYSSERKNIPPKKDKFNPLRIDMAKVIPLTSSELSLQCLECHIIFSDSKSRDRHIKLSHPAEYHEKMLADVVFTCYVCDQSFTCSTELMAHQRTHTDNERFKCPFCNEAFYRSSELTSHKKKIHYNKHGYTCTECGKTFKTFTLLRYHQRGHSAEKPYVCPHRQCCKTFSTTKCFRSHLQKHKNEDGVVDQTSLSTIIKSNKTKETNERKFPCANCDAVFKTFKARLLHIKNKHSQESQSSVLLMTQPKAPRPTLLPIANGQPQTLFVETVGPTSQPMAANKLDAVEIKRLIEKLGNVQKVNQLVILPLQPQYVGLPQPQPLHVNFTQSECEQPNTDPSRANQINFQLSAEMENLQPKEAVVLSQEILVSSANTEAQDTPFELTQTETQMQTEEIHLELIPIQTETSVFLNQTQMQASQNNSDHELAHAVEEHIPVTLANETVETNNEPPLISQPETANSNHVEGIESLESNNNPPLILQPETSKSYQVEGIVALETNDQPVLISHPEIVKSNHVEDFATLETNHEPPAISQAELAHVEDIVLVYTEAPEETVSSTEAACLTKKNSNKQDSLEISVESQSRVIIEQGDIEKLSKVQELQQIQAQKDKVEEESSMTEPQSHPNSFNCVQIETLINLQKSSLPTPNQTGAKLQDSPFVQKKLPSKKKRSKKKLADELEVKESSKESDKKVASTKSIKTPSKVIPKKKEKTKNKKLVVRFGPSEKKKSSKPKVKKTSKTKENQNRQICDQDQVPALSQHETKLDSSPKLQKDKKGKGVESPTGAAVRSVGQTKHAVDVVLVTPGAAQQGKPQKKKMKNRNNLDKKAKSVPQAQQEETPAPVPKKRKQAKISEDDGNKKPKVRKTQNDGIQKKKQKIPKQKATQAKSRPGPPDLALLEKQALLLLKGHKQPQLKVHKLDATELEKSPPSKNKKVQNKTKKAQSKSLNVARQKKKKSGGNILLEHQGESLFSEMPPVENSPSSVSTKPKVVRKRKAPTKIDQEIALSPPYSQLTLGCQDCGKTFSEVSALQEHMAAWHSAGKSAFSDEINVTKKRVIERSPNEKRILSNIFEIQVATDWDIETEVGEIVGERLSFPALSRSPSLTLASSGADGKEQNGEKCADGILEEPPEKNPSEVCKISPQSSTPAICKPLLPQEITVNAAKSVLEKEQSNEVRPITETSCDKLDDITEEEIKEELPLGVNLIMVGDQNEEENHNDQFENEVSDPCSQSQEPPKDTNVVLNQNLLSEAEIKQEEEEVLVRKADDHKRVIGGSSVKKGKKRVGRAQGKKPVGRRTSTENRSKKDMEGHEDAQECQVLYHLCVLDSPEGKSKETVKKGVVSETSQPSSSEDTPEEQVVFELDSVTTSVMDIVNSEEGSFETSRELDREGSSPGIILEKFLTARERNIEPSNTHHSIRQANSKLDTSKVTSSYTSSDVKIEERASNLSHHNQISSEDGCVRGVQMLFVKAEEHVSTDDMVQSLQPADPHRVTRPDKAADKNKDGNSSDSRVVPVQNYSKQCIFYPVKEEERELLVESPHEARKNLSSEEHAGHSPGTEECEEIRVDSVQMDIQHLHPNSEEGDGTAEEQRTQGFLEFLSLNSDTDDTGNVHSEPEAETIVMSCYHGIQSNGTVHQNATERCDSSGGTNLEASPMSHKEPERRLRKPINYFNQYFSLDTWNEIAVCSRETSNLADPITEKEVAKYVGIHIAMGTLKFPSTKLYWEDYTRVPLISDAMSASRFSELACKIQLVSSAGPSMDTSTDQQFEESTRERPKQSNMAAHICRNLKTNPLFKVMPLIRKVQDGCRALERNGSYGVDQYPLPFQRHPTHSLLHTVVISGGGLVLDFNLSIDDSNRENVVEKMVSKGKARNEGMVFLCKPELSTPSMLEHLLEKGVQSAGKVGGARGQIGDEFVSSDGKLKLFRCHHGFILSAVVKEKPRSTSLVSGFERAIKAANLNRDLRSLYRTPCTNLAVSAWPQSVLWDLIDLVLVNAWIQYKQDYCDTAEVLSLMAFRLEVAKALILSSGVDAQDSSPPCPPAPKLHAPETNSRPSQVLENPLPDEHIRYDGFGHWPEQLAEGDEARRCRFGGCERISRVRCLKCCVYLCISRNHNCFLKFHSQGSS